MAGRAYVYSVPVRNGVDNNFPGKIAFPTQLGQGSLATQGCRDDRGNSGTGYAFFQMAGFQMAGIDTDLRDMHVLPGAIQQQPERADLCRPIRWVGICKTRRL